MADSKGLQTHFVQPCQSRLPELRRRPFSNQEFVYHSGGIELVVGILLHEKGLFGAAFSFQICSINLNRSHGTA